MDTRGASTKGCAPSCSGCRLHQGVMQAGKPPLLLAREVWEQPLTSYNSSLPPSWGEAAARSLPEGSQRAPAGASQCKNCIQELGNFGIFGCQSVLGSRIWIPSCLRSGHVVPGVFFAGSGRTKPCVPGKWPAFSARLRAARFPSRSGALESCRGMVFTVFPPPLSAGLASFGSSLSKRKEWSHALDFLSCCQRAAGR